MVERFQDPERAIAYLCDAMRQDGVGDKVLITSYLKGHQRARVRIPEQSAGSFRGKARSDSGLIRAAIPF